MSDQLLERITHHPDICHGKPCIRGLRYPVEFILELLSSGMTTEEILADYDDLERLDIQAVLLFAARLSQIKSIHKIAIPSMSEERAKELETMPDEEIDYSDIPPLDEEFFKKAKRVESTPTKPVRSPFV